MPTVSDILKDIPLSGYAHIDALLDPYGPQWNNLMGYAPNTINYSFSLVAYKPLVHKAVPVALVELSALQQEGVRLAMDYMSLVTGIAFVETSSAAVASIHFANGDIDRANVVGMAWWQEKYWHDGDTVTDFRINGTIYLDNAPYEDYNAVPLPGDYAYETVLHELGHMLGLKHPFIGDVRLPKEVDSTDYTLMSYTHHDGPYSDFGEYDLAALNWLYGGDGLGGELGLGTAGRYLTGTSANDVLAGGAGNDRLDGGAGLDTVVYTGLRADHAIARTAHGYTVTGAGATDTVENAERLAFGDTLVALDIEGAGGQAYRLYQAAFDRKPDAAGLGYWIDAMDRGQGLRDVAANFIASEEFATLYGGNRPDHAVFVDRLYQNILHRAPEQAGYDYWLGVLEQGVDRAFVLASFSESSENSDAIAKLIGNGFEYKAWMAAV